MQTIDFSYNWNNKLNCKAFTTWRVHNPKKYYEGAIVDITLKDEHLFTAAIVKVRTLLLNQANEYISYLDTGYSVEEFQDIVLKMYGAKAKTMKFDFILLERIEE